ncbi:MAG: hypothetical protein IPJ40_08635 [Saprospirales bacterium]|nr:hypothetical protein [Saprospirales bacterium]
MARFCAARIGIEAIKSNPELPKQEMEFVNQWKEENILESFFIAVTKKDAVLIFQNIDESKSKNSGKYLFLICRKLTYLEQKF